MSFLRRLAAANNPPRIPNPNPANPVLVSVVPVFGNCFLLTLLEDFSVASDLATSEVFTVVPSTTVTGTVIVTWVPSANLSVTLAVPLPRTAVSGFSTLTTSTPSGKFSFDKISLSVKTSPCLTITVPFTNSFDKSYSSFSRTTAGMW